MGTRACIGRMVNGKPTEFRGRYHHWDGYPDGLGKTLFELYNGHFKRDLAAMLTLLLDEHPAGWSTINDKDFTEAPGFDGAGPNCYCHGDRSESAHVVTQANASDIGCEYAYVFGADEHMHVLSSYCETGEKMIGAFGWGDPKGTWREIASVDLLGAAPDWAKMT